MDTKKTKILASGIKFSIETKNKQIARVYLYLLKNNLHKEPFGFIEDAFVEKSHRGKGLGTKILKEVIKEARQKGCYKLIANSRHENKSAHKLYENLKFKNWGKEFRLNL